MPPGRPIILPGFDHGEQLKINFEHPSFTPSWLRRMFTDEEVLQKQEIVTDLTGPAQESLLRQIRYGNNITVLFRACSACRYYMNTPGFWAAMGSGFGAGPDQLIPLVDAFVRAREIYLERSHDLSFRSAATVAVDTWIDNLNKRQQFRPVGIRGEPLEAARRYYENTKDRYLQVNSAQVRYRPVPESRSARKRSPSPTPAASPRNVKRRPSEYSFDRRDFTPASTSFSPPPLRTNGTELKILGQAMQQYDPPSSTGDGSRHYDSYSRPPPRDLPDRMVVRGSARRDSVYSVPPRPKSRDSIPRSDTATGELEQVQEANFLLRDRIAKLEKRLAAVTASTEGDGALDGKETLLANFERRLAAMEDRPATKDSITPEVKTILEKFEKQLLRAEERWVQDTEKARATIASLESKLLASASHDSDSKHTEVIQSLQSRIACLEAKAAVDEAQVAVVAQHIQSKSTEPTSPGPGLAVPETQAGQQITPVTENFAKRLASLENKLASSDASSNKHSGQDDVVGQIAHLDARLTREEVATRDTNERISSLEKQHFESARLTATRTFVEANSKRLGDRVSSLEKQQLEMEDYKNGQNASIRAIKETTVALEFQTDQLMKTHEMYQLPESQSALRAVQNNVEDMWKKINGLPTITSVSEKTFQIEQHLRTLLEQHQRDMKEQLTDATKTLGDVKAQVKGVLKLLNTTTSDKASRHSVEALERKLAAVFKDLDSAKQSSLGSNRVEKLEAKVKELSEDVQHALQGVSTAELASKLQEVYARVDGIEKKAESVRDTTLSTEVAELNDRYNMLTTGLKGLAFELTKFGL